jgi:hypothetical protein
MSIVTIAGHLPSPSLRKEHFMGNNSLCSLSLLAAVALATSAGGAVLLDQQPISGPMRPSQLWQDPGPDGNDLDGDAVCWTDFTVAELTPISHIEWWGTGACELGFRIEIWKQDPGTVAYQPYGIFYYGGVDSAEPLVTFDTTAAVAGLGPNGTLHWVLDLPNPIMVPANSPVNPRWFIDIVGLTAVPYATWNWAKGSDPTPKSYQFIRGEGPQFYSLGEGRALVLGNTLNACPADLTGDGTVDGADLSTLLSGWGGSGSGDIDGSGTVNAADLTALLGAWGVCP